MNSVDGTEAKTALVTGGAQGIGKGIARHLLENGWRVVLFDIDDEAVRETQEELRPLGPVEFVCGDVANESDVERAIGATLDFSGRIDGIVNNAGIAAPSGGPVEQLALEHWSRVIAVNLTGAFLVAKHAAPHLRQSKGAIVNIASTRAVQSEPGNEAYSASKGGLVALTHALAMSLGPDVRANCVSPGWIDVSEWQKSARRCKPNFSPQDHAQHPAGRVGAPADIAGMVAYLLSDAAGFITGQNFVVDGGMTKKMIYVE